MCQILLVAYFKALLRYFSGRTQDSWSKYEVRTSRLPNRRVKRYSTGLYQLQLTTCRFLKSIPVWKNLVKPVQNKTEGCLYANQKNTVGRLTSISKCFHPRQKSTCSAIRSLNEVRAVLWLAHLNIKGHGTEPRTDVCPHNVTSVQKRHNLQQGLQFISNLSNLVSFSTDGPILLWLLTLHSPVVTICTARFNIQQFYVLPTQCIYVFCVDLRTNSDYFPIQH